MYRFVMFQGNIFAVFMLVVKTILATIVPTSNWVMIKPTTADSKTVLASRKGIHFIN